MPTAKTGDTIVVPLQIGGEYTAGDASTIPDGTVRALRNYSIRPNRFDGRAPFVAESGSPSFGSITLARFLRFENLSNKTTDTLLVTPAGTMYKKNSNGIDYASVAAGITPLTNVTHYLSDFANILGKVYAMFTNQSSSGIPAARLKWDGTTALFDASASDVLESALYSRTITAFISRLFFGYPVLTITPQTQTSLDASVYDLTSAVWHRANINSSNITANGITQCRFYPTSTTPFASYALAYTGSGPTAGLASFASTATIRSVTFRSDLLCEHESYEMPITLRVLLITDWQANHAYAKGDLISDGSAYRHRVTTAGTSGGVAPGWTATRNGTTADNTVTWTNEGDQVLGETEDFIPHSSGTEGKSPATFYVTAPIPRATNTITVSPLIAFGNSQISSVTLAPVVVSVKDALADGNAQKQNYGQQITIGEYQYPFVNTETATSRTAELEDIVWSEINQPTRIRAQNTFPLTEIAGYVTAAAVAGGRLFYFKRRGMWQFARTNDANVPIIPERPARTDVGCIGPRCIDVFRDELFWIDEHEVYRMKVGGEPIGICGPGMREEILARGTNWVETTTAPTNVPCLVIDKANHDVFVFTQIGKIYTYNIDTESWAYIDNGSLTASCQLFFDVVGQRVIGGGTPFGSGVARFDETSSSNELGASITNDLVFKPIESFAPRAELRINGITVFHNATASQSGNTLSVQYSTDRGVNYTTPTGYPIVVNLNDAMIPMPFTALGNSFTIKLSRVGDGGAAKWSLSKAYATIEIVSGEYPYVTETSA